jgi:hypothetical protein
LELAKGKRRRSGYNKELSIDNKALVKVEYGFINETMENIIQHPSNRSATPLSRSTSDFGSRTSGGWTENGNFPGTDTSPSSVCSGILEKLDPRLLGQAAAQSNVMSEYDAIEVVDLTNLDEDITYTPN